MTMTGALRSRYLDHRISDELRDKQSVLDDVRKKNEFLVVRVRLSCLVARYGGRILTHVFIHTGCLRITFAYTNVFHSCRSNER